MKDEEKKREKQGEKGTDCWCWNNERHIDIAGWKAGKIILKVTSATWNSLKFNVLWGKKRIAPSVRLGIIRKNKTPFSSGGRYAQNRS
jgi:hypothetical protein